MTAVPAFQTQDALKPLPFDPAKLNGLSERLIHSHWENNYGGSVKALATIKAWGFEYKTCAFVWVKQTKNEERFATGMGYWTRANAEICLLATRGTPARLHADVHQVVSTPRMEHSRKPDEVAVRIERLVPGPYIELFARSAREGWDSWGNQAEAA